MPVTLWAAGVLEDHRLVGPCWTCAARVLRVPATQSGECRERAAGAATGAAMIGYNVTGCEFAAQSRGLTAPSMELPGVAIEHFSMRYNTTFEAPGPVFETVGTVVPKGGLCRFCSSRRWVRTVSGVRLCSVAWAAQELAELVQASVIDLSWALTIACAVVPR